MAPVTSERLRGRRPEPGDLADYVRMYGDPRVPEAWWPAEQRTPDDAASALRRSIEHWDRWGFGPWTVIERASEAVVGRIGLSHKVIEGRPEVEIGWFVAPDAWGRGYATEMAQEAVREAFTTLGLDTLVAVTTPANAASQAVMRKLGMTYEADVENAGQMHVLYRLSRVT